MRSYSVEAIVRSYMYHVYRAAAVWDPAVGQVLQCKPERSNTRTLFVVLSVSHCGYHQLYLTFASPLLAAAMLDKGTTVEKEPSKFGSLEFDRWKYLSSYLAMNPASACAIK